MWYPNVKDSSNGSGILTDSACSSSNMTIVSGIEYHKSGAFGFSVFGTSYGSLAAGGTAVLKCTTSYSSEQKVRHRIRVLNGKQNSKDGYAVTGTNSLYPSSNNPYETIVGDLADTGNFQISQRVEYNPVVTGTTNHITLTVTHSDTGSVYNKALTLTYKLPAANLKITSATTEKGGTCAVSSSTNTVTCTYPAKAFGPSDSAQVSVVTTAGTPGVAHPTASISSQGQVKTLNTINDSSITVVDKTGTNTPGTTASSADTDYGSYSLTKMASTNYISQTTKVTYTYVLRNNSKTHYISTAANAAATAILTDSTCPNITYGDGWGITDGRHTIAPDSAATLLCSATVSKTTTNTATTKNLTFSSKSDGGTWTWDEAPLIPVTAKNTVYFVGNTATDDPGTATEQNALTYQTPGTLVPISCPVPYVWAAVSMNPTTKLESSETYLYGMHQNETQFSLIPTNSNLYTGPGAYWQWGVGGDGLPWSGSNGNSTTFYTGSGSNAFKPITKQLYSYNAMAYNKKDHLIYAVTNSDNNLRSGQLITIDANNVIRRTGVYIPYPVWDSGATAAEQMDAKVRLNELQGTPGTFAQNKGPTGGFNAAFFDDDGNFYISQSSTTGTGNLYKFDLPSGKMTTVLKGSVQDGAWSDDYAYKDGYAYGIEYSKINDPTNVANYNLRVNNQGTANPHANTLEQINLKTGAIKYIALPKTSDGGTMWNADGYDVAWTYDGGDLGFLSKSGPNSNNSDPQKRSAVWYRLRVLNPDSANPTAQMIADGNAPYAYNGDGTQCTQSPADLTIKKTQLTQKIEPSGDVTWRVVVKNLGPGVSSGFSVKDTLPEGFTYKSATFPSGATDADGQAVSGNAGACTYDKTSRTVTCVPEVGSTGIAVGQSRVIEITATAPDMDHLMYDGGEKDLCFHNTATVDGNETDPDTDNNSSTTEEACIARSMNVSKKADSKYVSGSDKDGVYTATWTVKVTNTGASWIEYVHINEIPDLQHVDIVSVTWSGGPNNESNVTAKEVSPGVWEIAGDDTKDLCADHTDTYSVVVKFKLKTGETIDKVGPCVADGSGGFINKVSADGETGTDTDNTACESPEPRITIKKLGRNCDTDKKVCSLAGAQFSVYRANGTSCDGINTSASPITTLTTGSDGQAVSEPLNLSTWYNDGLEKSDSGNNDGYLDGSQYAAKHGPIDYCLVETKAPQGYQLLAKPMLYQIKTAGDTATAADWATISDAPANFGNHLPLTGGTSVAVLIIAGIALVGGGTMVYERNRKKEAAATK